jgi:hypothetical protein
MRKIKMFARNIREQGWLIYGAKVIQEPPVLS